MSRGSVILHDAEKKTHLWQRILRRIFILDHGKEISKISHISWKFLILTLAESEANLLIKLLRVILASERKEM